MMASPVPIPGAGAWALAAALVLLSAPALADDAWIGDLGPIAPPTGRMSAPRICSSARASAARPGRSSAWRRSRPKTRYANW